MYYSNFIKMIHILDDYLRSGTNSFDFDAYPNIMHKKKSKSKSSTKGKTKESKSTDIEKVLDDDDKEQINSELDNSVPEDIEMQLDELLGVIGGSTKELILDGNKKNIIITIGFIPQEIFNLIKTRHLAYTDATKEELPAFNAVMSSLNNDYISLESKEKKIAEEIYASIMKKSNKVIFVRLFPQQYDILHLLNLFYKNNECLITYVSYEIDDIFKEAENRLKRGIYSKPSTWIIGALERFFSKTSKKTDDSITVNKNDITKQLESWKKFYDSKKSLMDDVSRILGKSNEVVFIPKFKYHTLLKP